MSENKIKEVGHIEKGSGKHQSNIVYNSGGGISNSMCSNRNQVLDSDIRKKYEICDEYSYCIDANYWKGATLEQYFFKHRRQMVIERCQE